MPGTELPIQMWALALRILDSLNSNEKGRATKRKIRKCTKQWLAIIMTAIKANRNGVMQQGLHRIAKALKRNNERIPL